MEYSATVGGTDITDVNNKWLTLTKATRTFSGNPAAGDVDADINVPTVVNLCAKDSWGAQQCEDFNLLVVDNNEPILNLPSAIPDVFLQSDEAWDYTFPSDTFTESDGDEMVYKACQWDGTTCNNLPYTWGTINLTFDGPNRRF